MQKPTTDHSPEDIRFQRKLVESLLAASAETGYQTFPSKSEYILSEVVNGTIDYLGGEGGKIRFYPGSDTFQFHTQIYEELKNNLDSQDEKLQPRINQTLLILVEPRDIHRDVITPLEALYGGGTSGIGI
jgi:hypothetical protein